MESSVDDVARTSRPPPRREARRTKRVVLVANETVAAPGVRERIKQLVGG